MFARKLIHFAVMLSVVWAPQFAGAQALDPPPFEFADGPASGEPNIPVEISAEFSAATADQPARLFVTAMIDPGWHVYSVTQKPGGPTKTSITLDSSSPVELAGPFRPLEKPEIHFYEDAYPGLEVEEHEFKVVWFAPITIAEGIDPRSLTISGEVKGQACDELCIPFNIPFTARLGKGVDVSKAPPVAEASGPVDSQQPPQLEGPTYSGEYRAENSPVAISGLLLNSKVQPGGKTQLILSATPDARYHLYAQSDHDPNIIGAGEPTLIITEFSGGLEVATAATGSKVYEKPAAIGKGVVQRFYQGPVTWKAPITVPQDATPGPHVISGVMGYQVCSDTSCDSPRGARFQVTLNVGSQTSDSPVQVTFAPAKYGEAAIAAKAHLSKGGSTPSTSTQPDEDSSQASTVVDRSSIWKLLLLGFIGGAILNVMPCVLPVIGLKIMSFVQQAGESRSRAFALNAWFSVGLIAVWLLMATVAIVFRFVYGEFYTQGQHLANDGFNISLAAFIFVMSLSLLGVWEIPIPGFIGSSKANDLAAREGLTGALLKGVLTTILATPCIGPFMGSALGEALQRSPLEIFAMFFSLGLGMASPYLIIGLEPRLIGFLPKPGAWMETFKQVMGFILLGTVVWILTFVAPAKVVPSLLLMVGLGAACWWIGRIPITADGSKKATAWAAAMLMVVFVGWLAYRFVGPDMERKIERLIVSTAAERSGGSLKLTQHEKGDLPWEYFTEERFQEAQLEGGTIMVDFTADWCLVCKTLEHEVLNTTPVLEVVEKNGVIPMIADYTKRPEHLTKRINELQSVGVPVLAIYPAGSDTPSTVFRGPYTPAMLLEALEKAGPSRSTERKITSREETNKIAISQDN